MDHRRRHRRDATLALLDASAGIENAANPAHIGHDSLPACRSRRASASSSPRAATLLIQGVHWRARSQGPRHRGADRASRRGPLPGELFFDHRVVAVATSATTPGGSRNAALALARAPYVAFLDDDDLWLPGHLAAAGMVLGSRSRPQTPTPATPSCSRTTPRRVGEAAEEPRRAPPLPGGRTAEHPEPRRALDAERAAHPRGRRAPVRATRRRREFDGDLVAMEDWDLWLRLLLHGPIRVVREPRIIVAALRPQAATCARWPSAASPSPAARPMPGPCWKRSDRRALFGRLQHDLAYACLKAGDRQAARRAAQRAISLQPGRLKNYLYWLASVAGITP